MKNSQPKSNMGLIAVMVLIIVVILILSGVVGYMLFGEQLGLTKLFSHETTAPATGEITTAAVTTAEPTTAEPTWEVPDIVGMKANDAYTALNHAGTRFEIKREYSEDVDAEHVISQSPDAGTVIKDSEKVLVII